MKQIVELGKEERELKVNPEENLKRNKDTT